MILAHRSGIVSARRLRDAIHELTGTRYLVTTRPERVKRLHLRYGSYAPTEDTTEFNSVDVIRTCSHKPLFSELATKANLGAPTFYIQTPTNDDYPILVRQTLHSYGGKGIIVCTNEDEFTKVWQPGYVWTRFVNTTSEYRVHVADGEVYRVFKKLYIGDLEEEPEFPIRTMHSGNYRYSLRHTEGRYEKLANDVYELNKVLQGKFFALDVGWQPDLSRYFYFEANSAPGLNDNTALELAKRLHNLGAV